MLRFFVVGALFTVIASAYALYSINTTTRSIADDVKEKERLREELISSMAILKAERAYLSRPEVIEPLARRRAWLFLPCLPLRDWWCCILFVLTGCADLMPVWP